MRVLVAGASGAIGGRLVPRLVRLDLLDLLDADAVRKAVLEHEPEAIMHQAAALPDATFARNLDRILARTNELRTKGADALVLTERASSVSRTLGSRRAERGTAAVAGTLFPSSSTEKARW